MLEDSDQLPITITVTKHSIISEPTTLPDGVVERIVQRFECGMFGVLFNSLFQSMPSLMDEEYRRLSGDIDLDGT